MQEEGRTKFVAIVEEIKQMVPDLWDAVTRLVPRLVCRVVVNHYYCCCVPQILVGVDFYSEAATISIYFTYWLEDLFCNNWDVDNIRQVRLAARYFNFLIYESPGGVSTWPQWGLPNLLAIFRGTNESTYEPHLSTYPECQRSATRVPRRIYSQSFFLRSHRSSPVHPFRHHRWTLAGSDFLPMFNDGYQSQYCPQQLELAYWVISGIDSTDTAFIFNGVADQNTSLGR